MNTVAKTESVDGWKQKYFDYLGEVEKRERVFEDSISVLRKALVRVSVAAMGVDDELDASLEELRSQVRAEADHRDIDAQVAHVVQVVMRLDRKRGPGRKDFTAAGKQMLSAIDGLPLSKSLRRRHGALVAALSRPEPEFAAFAAAFAALLEGAISESLPATAASNDGSGGLIGRLFGGKGEQEVIDWTKTELGDRLRENLTRLVQNVSIVADLAADAARTRKMVEVARVPHDLPETVAAIADLVATSADLEKEKFKQFVADLSGRFDQLQGVISASLVNEQDSATAQEDLEAGFRGNVKRIRKHISEATDLDQLQRLVSKDVTDMLGSFEQFRTKETKRRKKFEASVQLLQTKLKDAKTQSVELTQQVEELRQKGRLDSLTGIPNREAFINRAQQDFDSWQRHGTPLTLVIADIDFFKRVNDSYGHQAGDRVLVEVAAALTGALRKTDICCRYGGEEFVMLLPHTVLEQGRIVAEKLRQVVAEKCFTFKDRRVEVTLSFGVAQILEAESIHALLERADAALYEAKAAGRNQVCVSNPLD